MRVEGAQRDPKGRCAGATHRAPCLEEDMNAFLALALICLGSVLFALVGIALVRRVVSRGVGEGHNDVSAAIFGVGGVIYAVFLAFLVIIIWEKHEDARANVAEEASMLGTLYRGSTALEPQAGAHLRMLIRRYTRAVIIDEWPVQARTGGAAESARAAGLDLFRLFRSTTPDAREGDHSINETLLGLIVQIQSDRNKRSLQAQDSVPPVMWVVAIISGLLVIVMSFFLYVDRSWPHVVMSSMLAAMIAMLLFVIFIFEKPFGGLMPMQPDAFTHSLQVYDSVDRTA
jgi:hypothetical protein